MENTNQLYSLRIILFFALMLTVSCRKKKEEEYNLSISKDKMQLVLIDIYAAVAASEMHPDKNKDSLKQVYFTEICAIHKLDESLLKSEIENLQSNPILNAEMQRGIVDSMNQITFSNKKY